MVETILQCALFLIFWPLKQYVRHPLKFTMNLIIKHQKTLWVFIGFLIFLIFAFAVYGGTHLAAQPSSLGTFQILEHSIWVPGLVLLATHIVLAMFAERQKALFAAGSYPPSPILYPFFCGKFFMMVRLVMAYSSGDLGTSIDYFTYQELILTSLHIIISVFLLSSFKSDPARASDMNNIILGVTCMDIFKTISMYVFWEFYSPGAIKSVFNRLPSVWTRVAAALIIHGLLDVVQTLATVFTMWIAKAVAGLNCCCADEEYAAMPLEGTRDERGAGLWSFTRLNLEADDEWCLLLFDRKRREAAN